MKTARLAIRLAAVTMSAALLAHAVPAPALDLDRLTQESDTIVTGEVILLQEGPTIDIEDGSSQFKARNVTAVLQVDQVIKGELPSRQMSINFLLPEVFRGWKSVALHTYAVFFLQLAADNTRKFTSPYYPTAIAIPGKPVTGTTAIDRVIAVIDGVLTSRESTADQRLNAVYLLSRSRSPASTDALHFLLNSDESALRLRAVGALLERNDASGLHLAIEALLRGSDGTSDVVRPDLLYAIAQGLKDPKAISDMKKLLVSSDPEIRRAATSALMHTQSPDAIAPLLSTLADSDFEVRYYGVVALAEITGQMNWRPNMQDFRADQEKYLKHWREWAEGR